MRARACGRSGKWRRRRRRMGCFSDPAGWNGRESAGADPRPCSGPAAGKSPPTTLQSRARRQCCALFGSVHTPRTLHTTHAASAKRLFSRSRFSSARPTSIPVVRDRPSPGSLAYKVRRYITFLCFGRCDFFFFFRKPHIYIYIYIERNGIRDNAPATVIAKNLNTIRKYIILGIIIL